MVSEHKATIVCGNAGAGKSTVGSHLAAKSGAALVDIDTCTERLGRLVLAAHKIPQDDRDSETYKRLLREPIYETLFDIARENLSHTPTVIVGPFTKERREPSWPLQLQERLGATVEIVYVHCDVAERRRRIVARGNPRDLGKLAAWDEYARAGHDETLPRFPHRFVDTTHGG